MGQVQRILYRGEPRIDQWGGQIYQVATNIFESFIFSTTDGTTPPVSSLYVDVDLTTLPQVNVLTHYVDTTSHLISLLPTPTSDFLARSSLTIIHYNATTGVITEVVSDPYVALVNVIWVSGAAGTVDFSNPPWGFSIGLKEFYTINVSTKEIIQLPVQWVYYNKVTGAIVSTHTPVHGDAPATDYPFISTPNMSTSLADSYMVDVGRVTPVLVLPPVVTVINTISDVNIGNVLVTAKTLLEAFQVGVTISNANVSSAFGELAGSLLVAETIAGVTVGLASVISTLTTTNSLISAQNALLTAQNQIQSDLRNDIHTLTTLGSDREVGIAVWGVPYYGDLHSLERAITMNALKKSNNIDSVSQEMIHPTVMPKV